LTDVWQTGGWDDMEPDRILATVLFTDIVESTAKAIELGDRHWRRLLERHNTLVRRELLRTHENTLVMRRSLDGHEDQGPAMA
jgi:class 3 adenylate cyclase